MSRRITLFGVASVCLVTSLAALADEDSHRAAAERLLEASRVEAMTEQMYAQMPQMLSQMIAQGDTSGMSAEQRQQLLTTAMDFVEKRVGYAAMKPDYVTLYAEAYSEEDLDALADFMESPLGQRFLDATPELMMSASELAQQRMMDAMPEMMQLLAEEAQEMGLER